MGAGNRTDLKRMEASASESGGDNLDKIQTALVTKPAAAGAGKKRKNALVTGDGKKRKKLVKTRVPQELVDEIMRRPVTPFPIIPEELVAGFSDECRAAFAMQKANTEKLMAVDADIISQYKDKGYAEMEEEEVIDSEEEKVDD